MRGLVSEMERMVANLQQEREAMRQGLAAAAALPASANGRKGRAPGGHGTATRATALRDERSAAVRALTARTHARDTRGGSSTHRGARPLPLASGGGKPPAVGGAGTRRELAADDVDMLLEAVIEGGDATLTAATARLAHAKLEAAERAAAQARAHEHTVVERMRKELDGTLEERMAAREARLREERIDEMHERSVRRLRARGVARALSRWQEQRTARLRLQRLLTFAAGRLASPRLAKVFARLLATWHHVHRNQWLREQSGRMGGAFLRSHLPSGFLSSASQGEGGRGLRELL